MGFVIALAGKGGTGKTTLAALMVRVIRQKKLGSILAIDADPNSNLGEALGVKVKESMGDILDEIAKHPEKIPAGMPKDRFIEYKIQNAIIEGDGFDLLTMGRPEGPGCYCYVNNVLRNVMAKLINDYGYVVIDNEAGLEHLSRRTTRSAQVMVIVSDASITGLRTAKRIQDLIKELDIKASKILLIVNRASKDIDNKELCDMEYCGFIAEDNKIQQISLNGGSLMDLDDQSDSLKSLSGIGDRIWQSS